MRTSDPFIERTLLPPPGAAGTQEFPPEFHELAAANRSSRAYVTWVQRALNRVLGLRLAEDGVPGTQTRSAIRSFQQRNGLKPDGVVGPLTEQKLRAVSGLPVPGSGGQAACPPPVFVDCPPPGNPFETLDHFAFDHAALVLARHLPQIDRVAGELAARDSRGAKAQTVLIAGHTDAVGTDDYNFGLSRRRAEAVLQALCTSLERRKPGLANTIRFQITPCGERQTKTNVELSRRVEIFLPAAPGPKRKCACAAGGDPGLIAWLQRSLNKSLGLRLPVTAAFDVPTRSALRSFQARLGLPLTAAITPPTQAALLNAGAEEAPCTVEPCEASCDLFLPTVNSKNYEDYVAAQTTGRVIPLINGRNSGGTGPNVDIAEAFDQMQAAVESLKAGASVYLAAWQFDPNIALTAPNPGGAKTWGELFRDKATLGVKIRVIMTEYDTIAPFHGQLHNQYLPAFDKLIDSLPNAARDNLKYLVSAHPATFFKRLAGSHHQKFMVVLNGVTTTAFCGGLDIAFLRTPAFWNNKSLFAWHDIHSRLEGLIARDLEKEFVLRWNREKGQSTVAARPGWKGMDTLKQLPASAPDRAKDRNQHKVQMLRTVSVQGRLVAIQSTRRDDVWQAYGRLIKCANEFLYMENQYFREPQLADLIVQRAKAKPELVVIIVVPAQIDDEPNAITAKGQYLQHEFFDRLFAGMNPKKLRVYTMFKRFIHSKFILIEDRALSLGSANANPRSFQLDTELNVLLEDAEAVRKFRLRLWAHDLGDSESNIAGWAVTDFIAEWDAVAKANQKLISKPDDMTGEGVIPFDYKTIPGRKNAIPDVLTELPFGERVTFPEGFEF